MNSVILQESVVPRAKQPDQDTLLARLCSPATETCCAVTCGAGREWHASTQTAYEGRLQPQPRTTTTHCAALAYTHTHRRFNQPGTHACSPWQLLLCRLLRAVFFGFWFRVRADFAPNRNHSKALGGSPRKMLCICATIPSRCSAWAAHGNDDHFHVGCRSFY